MPSWPRVVSRIAHVLVEDMALVPGNRVLLRGPNNLMMAACWLATLKAGLIAVPTMPLLRAKELKQVIDKAQVGAALCDARPQAELDANRQAGGEHFCPSLRRRCATSTAPAPMRWRRRWPASRTLSPPATPPPTTPA